LRLALHRNNAQDPGQRAQFYEAAADFREEQQDWLQQDVNLYCQGENSRGDTAGVRPSEQEMEFSIYFQQEMWNRDKVRRVGLMVVRANLVFGLKLQGDLHCEFRTRQGAKRGNVQITIPFKVMINTTMKPIVSPCFFQPVKDGQALNLVYALFRLAYSDNGAKNW
jgi:hypothetical protein